MIKALGFTLYGKKAASRRYRLDQYVAELAALGVDLQIDGLLDDEYLEQTYNGRKFSKLKLARAYAARIGRMRKLRDYDVCIVSGELFPLMPGQIEAAMLPIPYIYDFGDAHFIKYRQARFRYAPSIIADKFDHFIARAAAVTAGNHHLVSYARKWNGNAHFLPTVVPMQRYSQAPQRDPSRFTIGWIGSPSTASYLKMLHGPLARIGAEGPTRFIVMGGHCDPIPNVEVVNLHWSEEAEIDVINTFDVGVMPLTDDEWSRGKCAFKMIQYMACGVPALVSPVGANLDVAQGGRALLASDAREWVANLQLLRDDPLFAMALGAAGRQRIERSYSLEAATPVLANVIRGVVTRDRVNRSSYAHHDGAWATR
ncbi:MAG: glycosyltransferase family 4 protein [Hyphomicrobiales bacterium]|nr:glycosyltransferase family 4 protein [Hyphomicrobiales bacterium]